MVNSRRVAGAHGRIRIVWLLLCLVPTPTFVDAAPPTDQRTDLTELSLAELVNLEVGVVSRRAGSMAQVPAAVHALTPDDLARAGVTSLADALTLVPGVTVARADSSGWAVGIRGFTSRLARAQLVLIDGRSVYNPLFAGTYWEVQDTVLDDLERIEVVRGPGGTLWGANAVNGIVSIVTKPASETRGGLVSLGAGTEELFGTLRYGGGLGTKGAYRVYAKSFAREATWHADGSRYDDWHLTQGGFRSDFDLAVGHRLTVQGDLYGGRAGQRTRITAYSPPYLRDVDEDADLSGWNGLVRLERGSLRLQGYFDRSDRDEVTFKEVRSTADLDLLHRAGRLGRHELTWGLGYRRSTGDSQGIETVSVEPPKRTDELVTAFLQDELSLADERVRIVGGARLEHNSYTGLEVQPSVRGLWSPAPRHSVWAAFTRAVRTPSRVESDIDLTIGTSPTTPVFFRLLGNGGFQSETLRSFEAGYRAEFSAHLTVDVAAFLNLYDKLLGFDPGAPVVEPERVVHPVTTANSLEGTSSGFEASMLIRPSPRWLLQAGYSYLSLTLEPIPGSPSLTTGANEEGSSPRHQLQGRLSVSLSPKLEFSSGFRWVDRLRAQEVDSYAELDARLAFRPSPKVEVAVVGRNLLHPRHTEFLGDTPTPSQIERAVLATVRLRW